MSDQKRFSLDDYIDVAERIVKFNEKYPEGSLQTITWDVKLIGEQMFVVYRAAAYRTPDDKRPGFGIAWEPFPGLTPYTRNSELMNAETAAWGRAIVAVGLVASKKLASHQEVRARQEEPQPDKPSPQPTAAAAQPTERLASAKQRGLINARAGEHKMPASVLANVVLAATGNETRDFQSEEAAQSFLQRGLDRLPAGSVDKVLRGIEAEATPDD